MHSPAVDVEGGVAGRPAADLVPEASANTGPRGPPAPGAPAANCRQTAGTPDPTTPAGRAALAELFLREYHRLGGSAARTAPDDQAAAQTLRRRAFAWRATAGRIRGAPAVRWPHGVLAQLARSEALPVVGAEYARQHAYLQRVLGLGPSAAHSDAPAGT